MWCVYVLVGKEGGREGQGWEREKGGKGEREREIEIDFRRD